MICLLVFPVQTALITFAKHAVYFCRFIAGGANSSASNSLVRSDEPLLGRKREEKGRKEREPSWNKFMVTALRVGSQYIARIGVWLYWGYACWTEPGVCYDESGLCRQYAQEGRCTSAAVHQYANYCKHSCGLCGTRLTNRSYCPVV